MKTLFAVVLLFLVVALTTTTEPVPEIKPSMELALLKPDCNDETSPQMRLECRQCDRRGGDWSFIHNVCFD